MPAARSRPLLVAVTGGIASGKSELTRRFEALGVPVIDADVIARELVAVGEPALEAIALRFGAGVIAADGSLDRSALRRIVFADAGERAALDALLHPRVRAAMRARASSVDGPYVLLAVPLLVENAQFDWVDRVLVVDAPVALQVERVMRRDGVDRVAAQRVLAAQASRWERLAAADDVVVNDAGLEWLDAVVGRLDVRYRGVAARA
jgi:dephospho-CoA kinase